jgi:hypothetical protein
MIEFLSSVKPWIYSSLMLPFIIHFFNKKKKIDRLVPTIEFFQANKKKRLFAISFQEKTLFFLRLLLISLFILYLLNPVFYSHEKNKKNLLLSSNPELLNNAFKSYDYYPLDAESNIWEILEQYDKSKNPPDTVLIHSNLNIARFKGKFYRPSFSVHFIDIKDKLPDYMYLKTDSIIILDEKNSVLKRFSFLKKQNKLLEINGKKLKIFTEEKQWFLSDGQISRKIRHFRQTKLALKADEASKSFLKKIISYLNTQENEIIFTDLKDENKRIEANYKNDKYHVKLQNQEFHFGMNDYNDFHDFIIRLRDYLYSDYDLLYYSSSDLTEKTFLQELQNTTIQKKNRSLQLQTYLFLGLLLLFLIERFVVLKSRNQ